MAVGDFNGDGIPDLVLTFWYSGGVKVLLGNGDGTFTALPYGPPGDAGINTQIVVGDFNQDGIPDLALINSGGDSVTILLGNGDGTFQQPLITNPPNGGVNAITVGDFNGDGIPDLAVASGNSVVTLVSWPRVEGGILAAIIHA